MNEQLSASIRSLAQGIVILVILGGTPDYHKKSALSQAVLAAQDQARGQSIPGRADNTAAF